MLLQWRSIALRLVVVVESIYCGIVYMAKNNAVVVNLEPSNQSRVEAWTLWLVLSGGDKDECPGEATVLGVNEATVVASLMMVAVSMLFCTTIRNAHVCCSSWASSRQLFYYAGPCCGPGWSSSAILEKQDDDTASAASLSSAQSGCRSGGRWDPT